MTGLTTSISSLVAGCWTILSAADEIFCTICINGANALAVSARFRWGALGWGGEGGPWTVGRVRAVPIFHQRGGHAVLCPAEVRQLESEEEAVLVTFALVSTLLD